MPSDVEKKYMAAYAAYQFNLKAVKPKQGTDGQ